MRTRILAILALVLAITLTHLLTLRPGHEWGDDFSLYVAHACNLVEDRPYADTGYVYNPYFPSLSPRAYPPGFPLVLAPVCAAFGPDLYVLKVYSVLFFGLLLGALAWGMGRELPWPHSLAVVALFGLNPFLWEHKDRLLSEMPFLLFSYLSLALMRLAGEPARSWRGRLAWGTCAGLTAYLAFATRTVGLALPMALLTSDLFRHRRIEASSWVAAEVFAVGAISQKLFIRGDNSYLDQLVFDPALFARTALSLLSALGQFFDNGHNSSARFAVLAALALFAALGLVVRLRQHGPTVFETFALFSVALLVIWPCAAYQKRFMVTVLPVFLIWAGTGAAALTRWRPVISTRLASGALGVAVLLSYAAAYTRLEAGPPREGVTDPAALELFDFVRASTPEQSVLLFQKPRAMALYTGRRASAHHIPKSDAELWHYMRSIVATHLVVGRPFPSSKSILEGFVSRNRERLDLEFENDKFSVYRLRVAGNMTQSPTPGWR